VASISGTVLAVCSCTVLPLFAGIYMRGAGIGPATAFLYSGPAIKPIGLRFIADGAVEADIPGVSAIECGNFRDHSLHSAREWAKVVLDQGISRDAFARVGG